MRIRRWLIRSLLLGILVAAVVTALALRFRPAAMERTEIFRGVYLTVEDLPATAQGGGKAMIVEVHWDTPGVRLRHRPFSYAFSPENPIATHYDLKLADPALAGSRAAVLVNTVRYTPDGLRDSLPGKGVRSLETVVASGRVSHVHEHSYLMYWDENREAHLEKTKPPSPEALEAARWGIGLQGVQISEGHPYPRSLDSLDDRIDRTFIGFDPTRNILFILAFEKVTGHYMIRRALEAGVVFGGQVDSGSATTLLVGEGAGGIRPHTGIRNWRPLGPWLEVHAEPVGN